MHDEPAPPAPTRQTARRHRAGDALGRYKPDENERQMDYHTKETVKDFGQFMAFFLGGVLIVVYLIALVAQHMMLPGQIAKIEQLRADVRCVSATESEDVVGQVTQTNQAIREAQRYNRIWWAAPTIPNAWDDVATIAVPNAGRVPEDCS